MLVPDVPCEMLTPGEDHAAFAITPTLESLSRGGPVALVCRHRGETVGSDEGHVLVRGGKIRGRWRRVHAEKGSEQSCVVITPCLANQIPCQSESQLFHHPLVPDSSGPGHITLIDNYFLYAKSSDTKTKNLEHSSIPVLTERNRMVCQGLSP